MNVLVLIVKLLLIIIVWGVVLLLIVRLYDVFVMIFVLKLGVLIEFLVNVIWLLYFNVWVNGLLVVCLKNIINLFNEKLIFFNYVLMFVLDILVIVLFVFYVF